MLLSVVSILAVGLTLAAVGWLLWIWHQETRPGVVVLLYHRIREDDEWNALVGAERNFSVSRSRFEEQLTWLRREGHDIVTLDTLHEILTGRRAVPSRAVAITFDDGSLSVLTHGLPALQNHDAPSTVFVTTDPEAWVFEDQPQLSPTELRTLQAAGMHIGAHGVSHHGMDRMPAHQLDAELMGSRQQLEAILTSPVTDMAIPLNFYDQRVLDAARRRGYRMVFTANPGLVRPGDDPMELRRIAVEGGMTLAEFVRNMSPRSLVQRRVVSALKRLPPKLLGETRWMPLRRRLFESPLGPWLTFRYLARAALILGLGWLALLTALLVAALR